MGSNTEKGKITASGNDKRCQASILIAGMGGEGVVLIGEILGIAATMDGLYASQRNTYGASQRGEAICSEVIISQKPVQFPFIESPTHFISLSKMGFDGYYYRLKDAQGTILLVDSSFPFSLRGLEKKAKVVKVPARQWAIEHSMPLSSNIIMLGSFAKVTKIITERSLKLAISEKVSKKARDQDLKALNAGFKMR